MVVLSSSSSPRLQRSAPQVTVTARVTGSSPETSPPPFRRSGRRTRILYISDSDSEPVRTQPRTSTPSPQAAKDFSFVPLTPCHGMGDSTKTSTLETVASLSPGPLYPEIPILDSGLEGAAAASEQTFIDPSTLPPDTQVIPRAHTGIQTETVACKQTGTQAAVKSSTTSSQTELTLSPEDTVIVVPRVGGVLRLEAFPQPQ